MKIVMITHDLKIDRRIIHEAKALIQQGHEVKILAFPWDGEEENDDGIYIKRTVVANVERKNYPKTYFVYKHLKKIIPKKILFRLRKLFDDVTVDYEKHFEGYLLGMALEEDAADVYHAHDLPSLSTAYKLAQKYNAMLVYDSHEIFCEQGFSKLQKHKWKAIEENYIKKVDEIITINYSAADYLKNTYRCNGPIVIMNKTEMLNMGNEVEEHILTLKEELEIPLDKKIVLYQGGIVKRRNLDNLILSMKETNEDIMLILLGSGEYRGELENIVAENNIVNKVKFIDEVSQKELLKYTLLADVGIIPYIGDCLNNYYCTPNKLFEFIAAGIPIVANNLPEIGKVVNGEFIGQTSDFSDYKCIAEAINKVMSNDEILKKYKDNIKKIQYKYSWDYEKEILLDLYKRIEMKGKK